MTPTEETPRERTRTRITGRDLGRGEIFGALFPPFVYLVLITAGVELGDPELVAIALLPPAAAAIRIALHRARPRPWGLLLGVVIGEVVVLGLLVGAIVLFGWMLSDPAGRP